MRRSHLFLLSLLAGSAVVAAARAQLPAGPPAGVSLALTQLFETNTSFTAKADLQVLDKTRKEWMRAPLQFAFLNGKVRLDLDFSLMKTASLPPQVIAGMKQLGIDRLASILRPDQNATYLVYPGARACVSTPLANPPASGAAYRLEKSILGQEPCDGHRCVKHRDRVKDAAGAVVLEAVTWNASDERDFPIRIETKDPDRNTTVLRFQQIRFIKPDSREFDPPRGFAIYDDPQKMIDALGKKAPGSATK